MTEKELLKQAINDAHPSRAEKLSSDEILTLSVSRGARVDRRGFAGFAAGLAVMALVGLAFFALTRGDSLEQDPGDAMPTPVSTADSSSQYNEPEPVSVKGNTVLDPKSGKQLVMEGTALQNVLDELKISEKEIAEVLNVKTELEHIDEQYNDIRYEFTLECINDHNIKTTYICEADALTGEPISYSFRRDAESFIAAARALDPDKDYTPEEIHAIFGEPDDLPPYSSVYYEGYRLYDGGLVIFGYNIGRDKKLIITLYPENSSGEVLYGDAGEFVITEIPPEEEGSYPDDIVVTFTSSVSEEYRQSHMSFVITDKDSYAGDIYRLYEDFAEGRITPDTLTLEKDPSLYMGGVWMSVTFTVNGKTIGLGGIDLNEEKAYIRLIDGASDCVTGNVYYFAPESEIYQWAEYIWRQYCDYYSNAR